MINWAYAISFAAVFTATGFLLGLVLAVVKDKIEKGKRA